MIVPKLRYSNSHYSVSIKRIVTHSSICCALNCYVYSEKDSQRLHHFPPFYVAWKNYLLRTSRINNIPSDILTTLLPTFSIGFRHVARIPCVYTIEKETIIENQYNKVYSAKTSTLGIFIHLKSKLSVQIFSKTNHSLLNKNPDRIAARLMSIRSANLPQSTPAFSNRALISLNLIQHPANNHNACVYSYTIHCSNSRPISIISLHAIVLDLRTHHGISALPPFPFTDNALVAALAGPAVILSQVTGSNPMSKGVFPNSYMLNYENFQNRAYTLKGKGQKERKREKERKKETLPKPYKW